MTEDQFVEKYGIVTWFVVMLTNKLFDKTDNEIEQKLKEIDNYGGHNV